MSYEERIQAHDVRLPVTYISDARRHFQIERDRFHIEWTLTHIRGKTVLDVGCYDGWLTWWLMDHGYEVDGVEMIHDLVEAARRLNKNKVFCAPFDTVDVTQMYDTVLCYETLEHIELEKLDFCIQKLEKLANRCVLVSLPDQDHRVNQPQHLWTPTRELIAQHFGGYTLEYHAYRDGTPPSFLLSKEKS